MQADTLISQTMLQLTINGEINMLATSTTELFSAKPSPAIMLKYNQIKLLIDSNHSANSLFTHMLASVYILRFLKNTTHTYKAQKKCYF